MKKIDVIKNETAMIQIGEKHGRQGHIDCPDLVYHWNLLRCRLPTRPERPQAW